MEYTNVNREEEKVKNLITDIKTEKNNTEEKIKELVDNVDQILKDADEQLDNNVLEANTKRELIESDITTKKSVISQKIKDSQLVYTKSTESIKTKIDDELVCYTIILAFLVFFYDFISVWIFQTTLIFRPTDWTNLSFDILGVPIVGIIFTILKFFLIGYVIYRMWGSFFEIKKTIDASFLDLEADQKQLAEIITSVPEITINKEKFKETKPFLKNARSTLESLVGIVGKSTPVIKEAYDHLTLITTYGKIVDDFEEVLNYNNILIEREFFYELKRRIPIQNQIISSENFWRDEIADQILTELKKKEVPISQKTILILFAEHNDISTTNLFREIRASDDERHYLAEALFRSHKLVLFHNLEYQVREIDAILKLMDSFDLSGINNFLSKYEKNVDEFSSALEHYNLPVRDGFFFDITKFVPSKDQMNNAENALKNNIINEIVDELKRNDRPASLRTLSLIYNENHGINTTNLFREINDSPSERQCLSKILIISQKLVSPPTNYTYQVQDIESILKNIDEFNLSKINNRLSKTIRCVDYLKSYIVFLNKNGLISEIPASIKIVNEEVDWSSVEFDEQIINLCYIIGMRIFANENLISPAFKEGFVRASITLKFHNEFSLQRAACHISATDEAATIIKAYYAKSEEKDRHQLVLLKELISDPSLIHGIYEQRNYHDFNFLKIQLEEGNWYESSSTFLKDFFEKTRQDIIEKIGEVENFIILKKIVKDTFKKVRIRTVEKAIDAQIFGAYIILFNSSMGPLHDCIDALSIRDLKAINRENRFEFRSRGQLDMLHSEYRIEPKYDFVKFSDSARVGIFQNDISFSQLQSDFMADLKTALKNKNQDFDIGVVIHRISPTKYNLGTLDPIGIEDIVEIKDLEIGRYIARLASDIIPFDKQASVMQNEPDMNVLNILDHYSIYELIRIEGESFNIIEQNFLERDELKQEILKKIQEELGINNFQSLASELGKGRINKEDVIPIIQKILLDHFSAIDGLKKPAPVRSKLLSQRFVDILKNLSLIYEIKE